MQNTFSINRAAELVERDRRTLKRILCDVPPDAEEKGSPRWKLRTIIDALAVHEGYAAEQNDTWHPNTEINDRIAAAHEAVQAEVARLRAMSDLAKRRARAVKTAPPLISAIDALLKEQNEQLGENEMLWECYRNHMFHLSIIGFISACEWNYGAGREAIDV